MPKKEKGIPNATQLESFTFKNRPKNTRTKIRPVKPFFVNKSIRPSSNSLNSK